jgi:haloacetate dehalogenase
VFFDGFALDHLDLGEVVVRVRHGGEGPPVVLLHGHPRTHATWHRVAPLLVANGFTVVCPDLRGYGRSTLPPDQADHAQASKRAMGRDVVALMERLGHARFAVCGHDRGALAAFRTAMDHPDHVSALVVMDGLPVVEHLERADWRFAADWWHWWFMGQTAKPAEVAINADPEWWYRVAGPEAMGAEAHEDLWAALRDPAVVHGMCEDYRAGLTIDREHDEADRAAGRRLQCPTLVLWSARDDMEDIYGDPIPIWGPWVADGIALQAGTVDSGHHAAEEAPEEVAAELSSFLGGPGSRHGRG